MLNFQHKNYKKQHNVLLRNSIMKMFGSTDLDLFLRWYILQLQVFRQQWHLPCSEQTQSTRPQLWDWTTPQSTCHR